MSIAQHIAKSSRHPTLVLVGRGALPPEDEWDATLRALDTDPRVRQRIDAVLQLRTLGAEVVVATADVTDEAAVTAVVADVRARHGRISTVIHSAGILHDALIALRTPVPDSAVVDVKAKGALVLGRVFAGHARPTCSCCSRRSARSSASPARSTTPRPTRSSTPTRPRPIASERTRALVVNWNAWQEVGMAVEAARVERDQAPMLAGETLAIAPPSCSTPSTTTTRSPRSPPASAASGSWLLNEHVVRGGEALIPGTGYLELVRSAAAVRPAQPGRSSCATSSSSPRSSSATARCAR